MAKESNISTGLLGESISCRYLKEQGYRIVTRNFLRKGGEIDIVAEKDGRLHFVEVKTISCENGNKSAWNPVDNLHSDKLKRIEATVYNYLSTFHVKREDWQIDAVLINLDRRNKKASIELIEAIG